MFFVNNSRSHRNKTKCMYTTVTGFHDFPYYDNCHKGHDSILYNKILIPGIKFWDNK